MPQASAVLDGIGRAWYNVPEIRERILDKGPLVLPEVGEAAPMQSQGCCVLNRDFLVPIVKAMHAAKCLHLPSVEMIYPELLSLWRTHFLARRKRYGSAGKGKGRYEKDPQISLPPEVLSSSWTDAKGIKTLLSYLRKLFLSSRISKESQLNE